MSEEIVQIRNVTKTYRAGGKVVRVLDRVNMDLRFGQFVTIQGVSGSGKTTLLNLLSGLEPPDEGQVIWQDRSIYKMGAPKLASWRNHMIGYVFQSYYLLPELTAWENVMLPAMIAGKSEKDEAESLLRLVGLSERADHYPSQLSGGEQQRVAIARAFRNDAPIIVADEPTGNLDNQSAQEVIDLLETLHERAGKTLIVVTHNHNIAQRGKVRYHLEAGRLMLLD
jgi:lipoprotein-releasing system ATP-binding protein